VLTNFEASFEAVFQGFEKMEYLAVAHIVNSVTLLAGAIFIVNRGGGVTEFAFVYLISSIIVVAFEFLVIIKKFILHDKKIDLGLCKSLLKDSFPFALSSMFLVVYIRFDNIILSIFKGETAVGLYTASYKLVDSLDLIYYSFIIALFPVTSRLFKHSKEKLKFSFEKSIKYLIVISIPIAVGTTLLADKIIESIYGSQYAPSVTVLQILVWSAVLVFINAIISNLLDSTDKQVIVAKQNAMAAVINFATNLMLIPTYSYIGAGIATLATQIFSLFYLSLSISKTEFKLQKKVLSLLISKVVFASLVMGILITYLKFMNILIVIPISVLLYFVFFYLVGGIEKDDIEIAKKLSGGFLNLR
jgi:O-antigen/teichoic acid export membrane protein